MAIKFSIPPIAPNSEAYIRQALELKASGDGDFTKKCSAWIKERTGTTKALMTTSCSHALDMAACLCGIKEGDEVIMSSYTFPSTANAFVGCGARIKFVDIRPDTLNIDETLIEAAINDKTRVIVPMHYAGVSCEMDIINTIADRCGLLVVEDAAQGIMSTFKGKALGTFGDFGCFSFHDTKNYSMGEGGALLIRDSGCVSKAEIIREKGTNRSRFYRGEIDKYSWVDWGSSYLPSEINTAYLWSQLEIADEIYSARLSLWNKYNEALRPLAEAGLIVLPHIPDECRHNAHLFYIKTVNSEIQADLIKFLRSEGADAVFHYVPLHSSEAGRKYGTFCGEDKFTTKENSRLLRLPLHNGMSENDVDEVVTLIMKYYQKNAKVTG